MLDPLALKLDMPRDILGELVQCGIGAGHVGRTGLTVFTALQAPTAEVRQILSDTAQLQYRHPEFEVYASANQPERPVSPEGAFDEGRLILRSDDFLTAPVKPGDAIALAHPLVGQSAISHSHV